MPLSIMSFRDAVSRDPRESLVYAADNLAQFTLADDQVSCKCDRALPGARPWDIVALRGNLDTEYLSWLRALGLGTDRIVAYDRVDKPISQLIAENPEPLLEQIQETGRTPVYVPWFSGEAEARAARCLGADLFGARADLTWRYNDKAVFKAICRRLGIPVVEDLLVEIQPDVAGNRRCFSDAVHHFLGSFESALVRAVFDNAGVSLVFKARDRDINAVYDKLVRHGVRQVLVEPFLDVVTSPNDQWIITREKEIFHMGKREQTCENGTHHIATLKIPEPGSSLEQQLLEISHTLVREMADAGYVGVAGIDYITTPSGYIFPVENNARFNGSSYVSLVLDALAGQGVLFPCWKFIKVTTAPCSFENLAMRLAPILYQGTGKASVFPYNCDTLGTTGAFSVIILAPDSGQINAMEKRLVRTGIC